MADRPDKQGEAGLAVHDGVQEGTVEGDEVFLHGGAVSAHFAPCDGGGLGAVAVDLNVGLLIDCRAEKIALGGRADPAQIGQLAVK